MDLLNTMVVLQQELHYYLPNTFLKQLCVNDTYNVSKVLCSHIGQYFKNYSSQS